MNKHFRAIHIGEKLPELTNEYDQEVLMWCKEEQLEDGSNLTDVINDQHENVKYLPNQKFPTNIVGVSDLAKAVENADILIFVLPHQYTRQACSDLVGKVKPTSFAVTLIKVNKLKNVKTRATDYCFDSRAFLLTKTRVNYFLFRKLSREL